MASHAEGSGLVILYPQASTMGVYGAGCWDWSGAITEEFDTHTGVTLSHLLQSLLCLSG